jgi:hypothetical protein
VQCSLPVLYCPGRMREGGSVVDSYISPSQRATLQQKLTTMIVIGLEWLSFTTIFIVSTKTPDREDKRNIMLAMKTNQRCTR